MVTCAGFGNIKLMRRSHCVINFLTCHARYCTIKDLSDVDFDIPVRRILRGVILGYQNAIKEKTLTLNLSNNPNSITRTLNKNKDFSTKSIYNWLERNIVGSHRSWI
jgi:hypothetical protein